MNRTIAISIAAFLLGLIYFGLFLTYGINLDDEGTILYQIERTLDGQTPYIDFHIGYTPATFYFHALLMKLFGVSVIPIRIVLALVNSAALAGMTLIAARLTVWWFAPLPALIYMVSIPVHGGEFAAFNIPYPAWYTTMLFVWSMYFMLRFGESGRRGWLIAGAFLAGLNFAYKPNAGLFNLAAASFAMLATIPFSEVATAGLERSLRRPLWWGLWVATLGGVWFVFAGNGGLIELRIFLLPITLGALLVAWRALVTPPAPGNPGFIASATSLLGTVLLVNLPWIVPVFMLLGPTRFASDVLFIGTGFEQFYYIEHPPVFALTGVVVLGFVVLAALARMAVARRWPTDVMSVIAIAGAGLCLWWVSRVALMPQGFLEAIRSEYEARILAVTLAINLAGLAAFARTIGIGEETRIESSRVGTVVIGALAMYLQLYPRTDFTHWVQAAPLSLVLGTVVLAGVAKAWAAAVAGRRRALAMAVCVTPVIAVIVLRAAPGIVAAFDLDGWRLHRAPHVELGLDRAPVWINAVRQERYRSLASMVGYLSENTTTDEPVFVFPNLDIVSFLSDRHNPTRHGYFYPEWPGRDVEAEVTSELMARPPRLTLLLRMHALFFMKAPVYYYTLRDFINSNYSSAFTIGPYHLVERRDVAGRWADEIDPSTQEAGTSVSPELAAALANVTEGGETEKIAALERLADMKLETAARPVLRALRDPSPAVRDAAVGALAACLDPDCARPLALTLRRGGLSAQKAIHATRVVGQTGGPGAARPLLRIAIAGFGTISDAALSALYHVATRDFIERYWFLTPDDQSARGKRLPKARLLRRRALRWIGDSKPDPWADPWAHTGTDPRLSVYAIWASVDAGAEAAERALKKGRESANDEIRTYAALELARRGAARGAFGPVAELLDEDDIWPPNVILELTDQTVAFDRRLGRLIDAGLSDQQQRAAWLAARVGSRRTVEALSRALGSADATMRMAAVWGLQSRGLHDRIDEIRPLLEDPDYRVRAFARRAVEHLEDRSL